MALSRHHFSDADSPTDAEAMTKMFSFKKSPETSSALSDFMRNVSAKEQKRVFKKVIEEAIKDQQSIIDRAKQIRRETEHPSPGNG